MYAKQTITCQHCGTIKQTSRHSSYGKFCSNKCQQDHQYASFIERWLDGLETGTVGKRGISAHVRRFIFDKYDNKCMQCGWCTRHPDDGRLPLEVDHIDGNWENTTEENLRLLCPNCHSLTPTYKARNKKSSRDYSPAS